MYEVLFRRSVESRLPIWLWRKLTRTSLKQVNWNDSKWCNDDRKSKFSGAFVAVGRRACVLGLSTGPGSDGHSSQHWAVARRTAFFAATRIVPSVSLFLPRHLFVPPAPSRTSYNKPDGRIFAFIFLEPKNARHGFMVLRLTDCGLLPMVPCTQWPSNEEGTLGQEWRKEALRQGSLIFL